jgi:prepilin peptidase CpaA
VYAAWTDWQRYTISNELVLALIGLYVLDALLPIKWADVRGDLAFTVIMCVPLLIFYSLAWIGGGDVKLLAAAFLWAGLSGALPFAIFLAAFSSLHALAAKLGWVRSQRNDSGRQRIPFAPAIATALTGTLITRVILSI